MKKVFSLIGVLLLASGMSFAQTASKFTLSGKALGYLGGGQSLVAADAASVIGFGAVVKARTDSIFLSTANGNANLASINVGGTQYTLPAEKLFKAVKLDPTKYEAYVFGEAGTVTSALATTPAYSAGGGFNRVIGKGVSANLIEVRYIHAAVPVTAGQVINDGVALSIGLNWGS